MDMSENEKQLEVTIPDDAEAKNEPIIEIIDDQVDQNAKSDEENKEDGEEDVESQLKSLKNRLEKERQARKEAEDRARQAQQKLHNAYNEVEDTNLQLVNSAIDTVKRDNDILKSHYAAAMAAGDYEKSAEIQETLAANSAKLLQLENGRHAMENKPKTAPQVSSDPVEQFASQLSSRSAEWIRKNPQCVTDPRLMQKMVAAHNLAVADGYQPDTDDYFSVIEDTLKLNRREKRQEMQDQQNEDSPLSSASKPVPRQAPPPPAPANRNGSTRPNVVRLTSAEAETARMFGMTDVEYAKHKVALQKEGKLPN
jgi:hypothetical protein